ncbi:phenylalanine--tRNA ligase subunit beta [Sulfurovum sp. NBC37-1]|uniref:phenylalanine--tRNA ligase subunit beta n=1 Tax=Sulfurovum sp. (strain NBC37-1) TaxID=387093 RepID=UPI00015875A0|nr:phenylalanine--tRNA ligase subunit beta [Sulfurovum sp. NBC37-1]BAF71507.1 phenylalanyl-tRNA synthetase, beta subunit [Sulfurovum sp. NBC37-1]
MIVTRSWLNEFIDLSEVSNDTLYETFNAIGLEVDSIDQVEIDPKVVVGKIISCEKHPDADKLNVCQIDVGGRVEQIVCGAANVLDAEYVAVATIGAVLPGNFEIKDAELRGVKSAGMVCASSELGLPEMGKGIMILDESIGELEVGKALGEYPTVADTIIELELTANRGDCLSIYGVARDLSAALNIEMKSFEYKQAERMKLGIARDAELHTEGEIDADLRYKLASIEYIDDTFLIRLRLAMVNVEAEGKLDRILAYATHTTGVILRAYDCVPLCNEDDKIMVSPRAKAKGIIEIFAHEKVLSIVGVNQVEDYKATDNTTKLLIEASYIDPDLLVEAVAEHQLKTDELYYKTSRGSNPDLGLGLQFLAYLMDNYSDINCYEGSLDVRVERHNKKIIVDSGEVSSIIGMDVEMNKIVTILKKLGFEITMMDHEHVAVAVPLFRHDIRNIQDITEEIVRIIGINNIEAKPFVFAEKRRLNATSDRFKAKKSIKNRAVGNGFYENVSYVFTERAVLEKYGFETVETALDLANPIAEELNTLRSTILTNLLNAVKRNVSYTKKSIPLFEIGAVFGSQREESEVLSFVFSGQIEGENVSNAGKPKMVDFASFTQKIGAVVGDFDLVPCTRNNALLHPYQSADIIVNGKVCGYMSKLHPMVQEEYGIPVTFIAELSLDALLPEHISATPISKFQGVYKDLSIVIDKSLSYYEVAKVLNGLDIPTLKESYPVDIYEDEKLGNKKSLTIRFFIQSMEKTLEDSDIEAVMAEVMQALETNCNAELR